MICKEHSKIKSASFRNCYALQSGESHLTVLEESLCPVLQTRNKKNLAIFGCLLRNDVNISYILSLRWSQILTYYEEFVNKGVCQICLLWWCLIILMSGLRHIVCFSLCDLLNASIVWSRNRNQTWNLPLSIVCLDLVRSFQKNGQPLFKQAQKHFWQRKIAWVSIFTSFPKQA